MKLIPSIHPVMKTILFILIINFAIMFLF